MSTDIKSLEPRSLWAHFSDLNAVPRPSKREERVIAFMRAFGESLGLPTTVDSVGNVIINKPATAGMEGRQTVALQSHLDMVHQKNATTDFDFETEGIRMRVDGDWVVAEGTTLGADNGIGVAAIMAILASKDIAHPPLEALFTIDEETGMTGAQGLEGGLLDAKILLNLDTEDDRELTIGCAGGVDVTGKGNYDPVTCRAGDHYRMDGVHPILQLVLDCTLPFLLAVPTYYLVEKKALALKDRFQVDRAAREDAAAIKAAKEG